VFDRVVLDEAKKCQYHYVLIDFLCERVSGDLRAAGDAADSRWFSAEEVSKLPLPEDTARVIRLGLAQK
jgi:ADP-ribose pyrophosphatase YjhB (NUDIX family)